MMSVAATISIAIEPTAAHTVAFQHEGKSNWNGDADEHFAGVVTNGHKEITEKLHDLSCQPIEVLL